MRADNIEPASSAWPVRRKCAYLFGHVRIDCARVYEKCAWLDAFLGNFAVRFEDNVMIGQHRDNIIGILGHLFGRIVDRATLCLHISACGRYDIVHVQAVTLQDNGARWAIVSMNLAAAKKTALLAIFAQLDCSTSTIIQNKDLKSGAMHTKKLALLAKRATLSHYPLSVRRTHLFLAAYVTSDIAQNDSILKITNSSDYVRMRCARISEPRRA